MKINAVITKPKLLQKNYKSPSKALIISFLTIIAGIILSVILFYLNHTFISDKLLKLFVNFQTDFSNKSFAEIFCGFLLSYLPYIFFAVIMGTCSLGVIPVVVLTFAQSLGIGSLASYIISQYALKGFEYFLLIIFPGKVICIFAMLILCESTLSSSMQIRELSEKSTGESFNKKVYITRVLAVSVLFAVSSLVDTVTVKLFSSLFNFT